MSRLNATVQLLGTAPSARPPPAARPAIVGRDPELEALERWFHGPRPALLEIEGEAGIGKTTLWEEALRLGRDTGCLVLACRPADVETAVSYGALATLLEPALAMVDGEVPPPRLRALEGALRLRDTPVSSLDETAVALGAMSVLRAAAAQRRVVVAIDDVQWLDASSRVVLTYALRNLRLDDDVSVTVTTREGAGGGPLRLAGSDLTLATERLRPGPLSVGALHRIVHRRLGTPLSRPNLVRLHSVSGGNPLHAIELARVVAAAGPHDKALEVPASLADVLRARVQPLSPPTRRLLVAVAAAGNVRPEQLTRLATTAEIDEAVEHGVLVLVDGHVGFSHPLLASTVYGDAGELLRTRVHSQLARLAESSEERARHLALAGTGPDQTVADALEHAAESSCRRGARSAGASLFEQAASLTPPDDESTRARRLVAAAHAHFQAGESDRARALLEAMAAGDSPIRFEALCRLGTLLDETVGGEASIAVFLEALHTDDPALAALAHRCLAQTLAYVGNIEQALSHAEAAVVAAEPLPDRVPLVYSLSMQAFVRKIAGHAEWREPLDRALTLESAVELPELDACPSAVEADTRRLLLEFDKARTAYQRMLARATQRDDVPTETWCHFGLASIEIASGRWGTAAEHEAQLSDLAEQTGLLRLPALRSEAHLAALRGDVASARALLGTVVDEAEPKGELHNLRAALQLEGLLELSLGDPGSALAPLRRAREIAEEMAVGEPSMLMFLLDEVEALAATGDPTSARYVLREFEARCGGNDAPWIASLVDRARGMIEAAAGRLDAARATLDRAVAAEDSVPLPLERARTRLALGRILRRTQRRSAAHAMLAEALARFEELGAPLWTERAREELARIGGRAPSSDDLTPTEQRIAELVAGGMTNREVATTLFVTPKTVESALTRVYRKLGVRSRTELARRLGDHG
jgi:DNA-binding CsgD family transcriptional regulator